MSISYEGGSLWPPSPSSLGIWCWLLPPSSSTSMPPAANEALRPSYRAAAIMSAVVLLLYVFTLAPTTAMWDASEYITAAYTLGIPHPPGNPLFVLLGRVASLLPF